jgi:uncharacterized membrane protein YraQ (UPF0718 family)
MDGEAEHAVEYEGTTYLFCGARHQSEFRADPARALGKVEPLGSEPAGLVALRKRETWREVVDVARGDVAMLRTELLVGYVVAGFAAALIPPEWLASALRVVGGVPIVGYLLLLVVGLGLAVVTFICSMGNVPIARFLAMAGIPLGANTTFIYGDLLIPPLVGIYRKSFPPKVTWAFLGLFTLGALVAGAAMDLLIGNVFGGLQHGSMELSDRFTLISNGLAILAMIVLAVVTRGGARAARENAASHAH